MMGIGCSKENKESRRIQNDLLKSKADEDQKIKLLLLGPGECGKSTILKQMQIIHNKGFGKADVLPYTPIIFNNILNAICILVGGIEKFGIFMQDQELKSFAFSLVTQIETYQISIPFPREVHMKVKKLWYSKEIQDVYLRRNELQLEDSAKYFLDDMDRIQEKDYIPTEQDILRARASTSGVIEVNFCQQNTTFRIFDVGGQKSERRKWIHCFDNVTAIIFMVAVSEYDRFLREDTTVNRMTDSLELFDTICNCQYFNNTDFTLFLNKIDLFVEKIKYKSLTLAFPDFDGPQTYDSCILYIEKQFLRKNKNQKVIRVHETCATDTTQVKTVIKNVIDTLIEKEMNSFTIS